MSLYFRVKNSTIPNVVWVQLRRQGTILSFRVDETLTHGDRKSISRAMDTLRARNDERVAAGDEKLTGNYPYEWSDDEH